MYNAVEFCSSERFSLRTNMHVLVTSITKTIGIFLVPIIGFSLKMEKIKIVLFTVFLQDTNQSCKLSKHMKFV